MTKSKGYTLPPGAWDAICAVEGIAPLSAEDRALLDEVRGLPPKVRMQRILKHIKTKSCPDDCCMPGLNGQCVACADES